MQPAGIEPRPNLQADPDTRAVGFGQNGTAQQPTLTTTDLAGIVTLASQPGVRFVVFDLRAEGYVHSRVISALIELARTLQRESRLLLVLVEDSTQYAAMRSAELTRHFLLVGAEPELRQRLNDLRDEFAFLQETDLTPQDLATALASGLTLDDLIQEVERIAP